MSKKIRSRKTVVQLGLIAAIAVGGGLMWGSTFATNMVHDQLVEQKIVFPPKGSPGLSPKEFPGLQRYAGQAVDDGPKAKAFANQFIGKHLKSVAGGKTYAEVSTASRANPGDQKLAGQRQALFEGETLRGLLLSAWGWSVVGWLTGMAAYAVFAGAGVTLAVLLWGFVRRREPAAPAPAPQLATAGLTV